MTAELGGAAESVAILVDHYHKCLKTIFDLIGPRVAFMCSNSSSFTLKKTYLSNRL